MINQDLIAKIAVRMSRDMDAAFTEEEVKNMLEARCETAEEYWQIMDECEEITRNWKPGTKPAPNPGDPDYDIYTSDSAL